MMQPTHICGWKLVEDETALEWVKERNAKSTDQITSAEDFTMLQERLLEVFNSDERIPYVGKTGSFTIILEG